MEVSDIKKKLDENFLDVWTLYLDQCVARHRKMVQLAGSPTKAFIAQIVYWHELLLLDEKGHTSTYSDVVSQIKQSDEKHLQKYIRNKKLTTSLVADLVGIPFETARRNLMVMCEESVLEKSDVFGFLVNKHSPFHAACVSDLNPMEKQNLCKLVHKITEGQQG